MPANEFEKQVQKRLDDFELNPSTSVWKNVEAQIRNKKRRRIILFFLLPVALGLLSYSIYYFLYTGNTTQEQSIRDNNSVTGATKLAETKEQPLQSSPGDNKRSPESSGIKTRANKDQTSTIKTTEHQDEVQPISVNGSTDTRANRNINTSGRNVVSVKNENLNAAKKQWVPTNKRPESSDEVVINTQNPTVASVKKEQDVKGVLKEANDNKEIQSIDANNNKLAEQIKDVAAETKDQPGTKSDSTKVEAPLQPVTPVIIAKTKTSRRKIRFGFEASGGLSSSHSEAFSLVKTARADAASYISNNNPAASASPFPGAATTLPPSSVNPGGTFKAGAVAELQFSNKSRVSIGLQYSYMSTRIKTGTADLALRYQSNSVSAMDHVYRGPQTNNYTNNYHFIAMPVAYHWQLNKNERMGLQWNAGVTPAYLVSTDALVYSSSDGGSYYHDDNAIRKFHLLAGTGFSLRLKNKKGMEYSFGPEISFDTRKLMTSTYQKQQYLFYGGVGVRILLPSGKK